MDFLLGFFASTLVAMLIIVTPGSSTAIVIKNSLLRSRKDGVGTALGITLGNIIWTSLGLAGVAALIVGSPSVFAVIKYVGAAYMGYLGVKLLFSKKKQYAVDGASLPKSFGTSFREGLLTNLSNPKLVLLLLAFFVQFITPSMPLYMQALYAYQVPFFALVWFSILSVLLTTESIRSRISPFLHYVELATGGILILFALLAVLSA